MAFSLSSRSFLAQFSLNSDASPRQRLWKAIAVRLKALGERVGFALFATVLEVLFGLGRRA